jgi:hypothetical protein
MHVDSSQVRSRQPESKFQGAVIERHVLSYLTTSANLAVNRMLYATARSSNCSLVLLCLHGWFPHDAQHSTT